MKFSSFSYFAWFGVKTILLNKKDPILGTVIVTDKCNLKCRHCSVNNITAVIHPYDQILREMRQLYGMGVRILFFCGGETFLWRDGDKTLRDLVIEAKQMGFLIVNVVTNGTFPIDLPEADQQHLRMIMTVYFEIFAITFFFDYKLDILYHVKGSSVLPSIHYRTFGICILQEFEQFGIHCR